MSSNVCIIQARMSSTRLPGKVLKPLGSMTLLEQVIRRAQAIEGITSVVVATVDSPAEDALVETAQTAGAEVFRGSRDDVLSRYIGAATQAQADYVMRITSDCPLLDPVVCNELLSTMVAGDHDYGFTIGYPHGLDCEVFPIKSLLEADKHASSNEDHEHVTLWMKRQEHYKIARAYPPDGNHTQKYRWVVDYPEDYAYLTELFKLLPGDMPGWQEVKAIADAHPHLMEINQARIDEWAELTAAIYEKSGD